MPKQNNANQDIRKLMKSCGVNMEMLGERIGISRGKVSRMLKVELGERMKELVMQHIDSIAAEKNAAVTQGGADSSCDAKFKIGDRVKIPSESMVIGIVKDIWSSVAQGKTMYAVENEQTRNNGLYAEDQLEPAPLPVEYAVNVSIEDNVVVICIIAHQGDKTWVHDRSHAHILHDGAVGLAQAVSFAGKRLFEHLDTKAGERIYFKK